MDVPQCNIGCKAIAEGGSASEGTVRCGDYSSMNVLDSRVRQRHEDVRAGRSRSEDWGGVLKHLDGSQSV